MRHSNSILVTTAITYHAGKAERERNIAAEDAGGLAQQKSVLQSGLVKRRKEVDNGSAFVSEMASHTPNEAEARLDVEVARRPYQRKFRLKQLLDHMQETAEQRIKRELHQVRLSRC